MKTYDNFGESGVFKNPPFRFTCQRARLFLRGVAQKPDALAVLTTLSAVDSVTVMVWHLQARQD
jgi:hypothetical protein